MPTNPSKPFIRVNLMKAVPGQSTIAVQDAFVFTNDAARNIFLDHLNEELPASAGSDSIRESISATDMNGVTPLVSRRLQNRENVRALIFGDSISAAPLFGDYFGVLRLLQERVGNAGAGGYNVNTESFPVYGGGTVGATSNWVRTYHSVPAAGWVEFSHEFQVRRFCNTAKIAWRAPVGGTATFKIQTCTDLDGAGVGTWVDQGSVRTAVSSGAEEEVGFATISLAEGLFRVRVLGVSGTTHVFNMELSHSTMAGCIINNHAEGGIAFTSFGEMSELRRKTFVDAVDPDVIFVMFKDDGPTMISNLEALRVTLEQSLKSGLPRDVVIIAPFPSIGVFYEGQKLQRQAMRDWASANKTAFVDLWDLIPDKSEFFNVDGVHIAGDTENAYIASLIVDRLGWIRYPKVQNISTPTIIQAERTSVLLIADTTTFTEDTVFRRPLPVGRWRITGRFLFTNDGSAGEGGKVEINHTGGATLVQIGYTRWGINGNPQVFTWPYFGGSIGLPLVLSGNTDKDLGYGYDIENLTVNVVRAGVITVSVAKEIVGGDVHFREGSYIRLEKI
jgi:hypothetical protein